MSAFAQVSIVGGLDAGPRISNIRGAGITQVVANNTYTSNVTFLINEDLGGGLSANGRWEIDINPTQTAAMTQGSPASPDNPNAANYMGNGYSFVGMTSSSLGTLNFGTINTATLDANGIGNPFGTALGSGYKSLAIGATRYQQALEYITPSMSGFSVKGLVAFKDDKQNLASTTSVPAATGQQTGNGRDGVTEVSLKYSQGPLNVIYSKLDVTSYYTQSMGTTTNCSAYAQAMATVALGNAAGSLGNSCTDGNTYAVSTLAANYKTGNTTVYGWYQTQKQSAQTQTVSSTTLAAVQATLDRQALGVAAKYQSTPTLAFSAGYRQIKRGNETYTSTGSQVPGSGISAITVAANQVAGGANNKTTLMAFGADYDLSKRTAVYFRYETIKDDAQVYNTLGVGGTGYSTDFANNKIMNTAVGVRHTF